MLKLSMSMSVINVSGFLLKDFQIRVVYLINETPLESLMASIVIVRCSCVLLEVEHILFKIPKDKQLFLEQ